MIKIWLYLSDLDNSYFLCPMSTVRWIDESNVKFQLSAAGNIMVTTDNNDL